MHNSLVKIPIDDFYLNGNIIAPVRAKSLVIFSHGSGGNRFSPRNKMIARELRNAGYATLLFDFMGEHEEENYKKRFEVDTLSQRLVSVTSWLHSQEEYENYDLAYFGAGLGSTMALNAAAKLNNRIKAIVCRGAQTDLVTDTIVKNIKCPTLLIAGEQDQETTKRNRQMMDKLTCPKKIVTIAGAGHLMEKPRMMQQVAKETIEWFDQYLRKDKMDPTQEYDTPDTEY